MFNGRQDAEGPTTSPLDERRLRYSVLFDGKLLVERSRDHECDAARALLAKGYTGKLTMCDGNTGKPRTIVNIEKAAKVRVTEESKDGIRFRKLTPAESPLTAESRAAEAGKANEAA